MGHILQVLSVDRCSQELHPWVLTSHAWRPQDAPLSLSYLVSKDGVQDSTDPALVDVYAAAAALVPQELVLPWPRRFRESKIAKPSNALKCHECLAHQTCRNAYFTAISLLFHCYFRGCSSSVSQSQQLQENSKLLVQSQQSTGDTKAAGCIYTSAVVPAAMHNRLV